MSACFLASLATSSRMALTRAEVERLLMGVSGLIGSAGSAGTLQWRRRVDCLDHPERLGGGATGEGCPEDNEGEERPLRSLVGASERENR